jgi:hypothetical protein
MKVLHERLNRLSFLSKETDQLFSTCTFLDSISYWFLLYSQMLEFYHKYRQAYTIIMLISFVMPASPGNLRQILT